MSVSKITTMETENEDVPAPMHGKLSAARLAPFVPASAGGSWRWGIATWTGYCDVLAVK